MAEKDEKLELRDIINDCMADWTWYPVPTDEQSVLIDQIVDLLYDLFNNQEARISYLNSPAGYLGDRTPVEVITKYKTTESLNWVRGAMEGLADWVY
jgi:hypothetical protein